MRTCLLLLVVVAATDLGQDARAWRGPARRGRQVARFNRDIVGWDGDELDGGCQREKCEVLLDEALTSHVLSCASQRRGLYALEPMTVRIQTLRSYDWSVTHA